MTDKTQGENKTNTSLLCLFNDSSPVSTKGFIKKVANAQLFRSFERPLPSGHSQRTRGDIFENNTKIFVFFRSFKCHEQHTAAPSINRNGTEIHKNNKWGKK